MAAERLQTVAETKAFAEDIDAMLSPDKRDAVIASIATAPEGGNLVRGTGGLRKRRIALPRRGKRGGARVIHPVSRRAISGLCGVSVCQERTREFVPGADQSLAPSGYGDKGASEGIMKKKRFDRLVAGLEDVHAHVTTGRFGGRITEIDVGAGDIRAVRKRSGMTQAQFAAAFGIGLGTLQKWERGERRPSGAAKSLLRVMQTDLPAVVRALGAPRVRQKIRARAENRAA